MSKPADEFARLSPGELLHSGTRRISSFLGTFVLAALLVVLGVGVVITDRPGRLGWLGDALTFPPPSFLADVLARSRGGALETQAQADYDRAVRQSAALADHLDTALVFLAGLLAVVGVLLALRAVLASSMTRYDVYQRRIDVASGVLNRHRTSAWLFEMQDVQLRQPPWLTLSRNAEIRIRLQDKSKVRIVGLGALHQQIALREELRDAALRERRALKSVWV
jgi:membrane protein YdbS with pleckstrin-like domain